MAFEENQHSSEQLAKQLEESKALFEISQMFAGTLDLPAILQQIADSAASLIKPSSQTILHLLDENENFLQPVAISGDFPSRRKSRMKFKPGEGVAGLALSTGQTININDILDDPRYVIGNLDQGVNRSLLVAPVKTSDKSLGTLSAQDKTPGSFTEVDERVLSILGNQAALAIERARLYNDLQSSLEYEKAAREQLVRSEKLAALGRMVASIAHELNNPIQAIQNALYLIKMEEKLSSQARDDLQTILDETDRMTNLIARLRETYCPITSEQFGPESINDLVEEVQKLLGTHLRHNDVSFEYIPDKNIPIIYMIRDQIKQVLLNISLNAVEAMPEGGTVSVKTVTQSDPDGVVVTIADNGQSISPTLLPYIFDPFVTTKEGGTGLGLAITYDIVQRHNGQISVENLPKNGAIFRVWLPTERPDSDDSRKNGLFQNAARGE